MTTGKEEKILSFDDLDTVVPDWYAAYEEDVNSVEKINTKEAKGDTMSVTTLIDDAENTVHPKCNNITTTTTTTNVLHLIANGTKCDAATQLYNGQIKYVV
jgi:hypothetical protein